MVHTSLAQQLRRPHIRRHRAQEEVHQEEYHQEDYQQEEQHNPANLNMSHILHAIEDLEMKHIEGQEKILAMQSKWMKQQEEWQKRHMEQQQEQYSQLTQALHQVTERQEHQDKCLQELNQRQLAQMKTFNEFSVLNEGRQLHREEFNA
nr:G-box-binding factor-like [Arachis hypogaea]